jgi:putative transposase
LSFVGTGHPNFLYDPSDLEELTIEYEGYTPWKAKKLAIGERSGKRPELPEHMQKQEAESSRLLKAAEQKNLNRKIEQTPAVTFRSIWKEEDTNV